MNGKPNNTATLGHISLCLLTSFAGCRCVSAAEVDISKLPPAAAVQIDFARDIRPILENSCLRCHGPEKPKNGFRLDNRQAALKGGEQGVDILPGNSAQSPLVHYVPYLVEDTEMPPIGKGQQLTLEQVSLLRAWIDQGAVWDKATLTNNFDFSFSPVLGGTAVSGNSRKFREQYWQKEGLNGGVEQFELFEQTSPDTRLLLNGHVLLDDYKIGCQWIGMMLDSFIRAGSSTGNISMIPAVIIQLWFSRHRAWTRICIWTSARPGLISDSLCRIGRA